MKMNMRCALLLALVTFTSGCGTQKMYDGEARAAEAVSTIRIADIMGGIGFKQIDDREVAWINGYSVEVLPGDHQILSVQRHRSCRTGPVLPCTSILMRHSYSCAAFRVSTRAGVQYEIASRSDERVIGLVMQGKQGNVVARIDNWQPVPGSNITATEISCPQQVLFEPRT